MSWIKCLKEVNLSKSLSVNIKIPRGSLNSYGVFAFLDVDYYRAIEDALPKGTSLKDFIGSGNAELFAFQVLDFVWDTLIMGTVMSDWGFDMLCLSVKEDANLVVNVFGTQVVTQNQFTDVSTELSTMVLNFVWPQSNVDEFRYDLNLFGYYSPVQSLLFTNGFDNSISDTLFHEHVHAVVDGLERELRYMMYGGDPSSVKEEIMTHAMTDRFDLFSNLRNELKSLSVETEKRGSMSSPIAVNFRSLSSQAGNDGKELTSKTNENRGSEGKTNTTKNSGLNLNNKTGNYQRSDKDLVSQVKSLRQLLKQTSTAGRDDQAIKLQLDKIKSTLQCSGLSQILSATERVIAKPSKPGKVK